MTFTWQTHTHPLVVLSPMAGYTDTVFRSLVKEFAPSVITISELASATALAHCGEKTSHLIRFTDIERPYIVQLFGKHPEEFYDAIKFVEKNFHPDGFDINMGCPAKKAIKSDHGAALLRKPDLACEIARAARSATKLPLSVKTRLGWTDPNDILNFAPRLAATGIDALLIHGRTYSQGFSGLSDWTNIYKVKDMLDIPVLGNGDIKSQEDFTAKLKNLDGVLVGRGTFGNPWLLAELTGEGQRPEEFKDKIPLIFRHAELAEQDGGRSAMLELRKHLVCYVKSLPNAKTLREKLIYIETAQEVKDILKDYL